MKSPELWLVYTHGKVLKPHHRLANHGKAGFWTSWERKARAGDAHARAMVAKYQQRPAEELYDVQKDPHCLVNLIEEPSLAVNGDNLRCERDVQGNCIRSNPCSGSGHLTDYDDDCLAEIEERAWSSPIFVDFSEVPLSTEAG